MGRGAFTVITSLTVAANSQDVVNVPGEYVVCTASDQTTFGIGIDSDPAQDFAQGFSFRMPEGEAFGQVIVDNPSGAVLTVSLVIGFGEFNDQRLSVTGPLSIGSIVAVEPGAHETLRTAGESTIAAGAKFQVWTFVVGRRRVWVSSLATNTGPFRVGDSAVSATAGYELLPGEKLELAVNDNVWAYNGGLASGKVAVTWAED